MNKAQELRRKIPNRKIEIQQKLQKSAETFYNLSLALISDISELDDLPETDSVVIEFDPCPPEGKARVSTTPAILDGDLKESLTYAPKLKNGYTGLEFNIEAFKMMKAMFDGEEGYSVDIGTKRSSFDDYEHHHITVEMKISQDDDSN